MQLAKFIGDIATGERQDTPGAPVNEARRKGGLKGGKARAKKLPPKKRSAIAKRAARARWGT
jgi:hypothetical protein